MVAFSTNFDGEYSREKLAVSSAQYAAMKTPVIQ